MSDFKAKMHQFDFSWGSAPDPARGAYLNHLAVFKATSKGTEREEKGKGNGRGRREVDEGKGRRGEGICWTNVKLLPTRL